MELDELLAMTVAKGASDLFLKVGVPPSVRIVGEIVNLGEEALTENNIKEMFNKMATERARKEFEDSNEMDLSYEIEKVGRFRVNVFRQRGHLGMALRYVKSRIPTFEELNLPVEQLRRISLLPRGLILVTGIAGSGKSTTLAAMIGFVNCNAQKHIVTVEDPIEFSFSDAKSIIDQREVGEDTKTFNSALKHVLRQNPDLIMIGEMRDKETIESALNAAESGHLVLSTLHTVNAMQAVERIMSLFPPHQHDFLRLQLSQLLQGVISQRLIKTKDGTGLVPAVEIMLATPTIKELLLSGKTNELYKAIKEGAYYGTQTFNQALMVLLQKDIISIDDALKAADNPEELKLELRGIIKGGGTSFR